MSVSRVLSPFPEALFHPHSRPDCRRRLILTRMGVAPETETDAHKEVRQNGRAPQSTASCIVRRRVRVRSNKQSASYRARVHVAGQACGDVLEVLETHSSPEQAPSQAGFLPSTRHRTPLVRETLVAFHIKCTSRKSNTRYEPCICFVVYHCPATEPVAMQFAGYSCPSCRNHCSSNSATRRHARTCNVLQGDLKADHYVPLSALGAIKPLKLHFDPDLRRPFCHQCNHFVVCERLFPQNFIQSVPLLLHRKASGASQLALARLPSHLRARTYRGCVSSSAQPAHCRSTDSPSGYVCRSYLGVFLKKHFDDPSTSARPQPLVITPSSLQPGIRILAQTQKIAMLGFR